MSSVRFRARLEATEEGTYVVVPPDAVAALRATGRTSVGGTVDGEPVRGQVMPYRFEGIGRKVVMGITKAQRAAIGKVVGDMVEVELTRDDRPRSADLVVPPELVAALAADPPARAAFDALAPSRRREIADHVTDAKRPETRQRRAELALERLRA